MYRSDQLRMTALPPRIRQSGRVSASDLEVVADILLEHWDPLGVRETDEEPEREYLHEAAAVIDILSTDPTAAELTERLSYMRRGLGLPDRSRDEHAARVLWSWRVNRR